jgi:hypothetical protein
MQSSTFDRQQRIAGRSTTVVLICAMGSLIGGVDIIQQAHARSVAPFEVDVVRPAVFSAADGQRPPKPNAGEPTTPPAPIQPAHGPTSQHPGETIDDPDW